MRGSAACIALAERRALSVRNAAVWFICFFVVLMDDGGLAGGVLQSFLVFRKGRGQLCFLPEVFFVLFCVFCLALRGFLLRVVSLRTGCTGVALVIPSTSTDAGVASVLMAGEALVREMRMAAKAMVRMVVFIPLFCIVLRVQSYGGEKRCTITCRRHNPKSGDRVCYFSYPLQKQNTHMWV